MIVDGHLPVRSAEGEEHHVVYEGPAHLIAMVETVNDLPLLPDGEQWVLVRRKIKPEAG